METISRKDLTMAYLAGYIDADGCISFQRMVNNRRTKKTAFLTPYVSITTTCTLTYEKLLEIYNEYHIPVHISIKKNGKSENRMPVYVFRTIGMKRSKVILSLIVPYLIGKKREAELTLEYISIRERLFATKTHDIREDAIFQEMKKIKGSRNIVRNPQRLYARLH